MHPGLLKSQYEKAVRLVAGRLLTPLGFSLRNDRAAEAIFAESDHCRLWFVAERFIVFVERLGEQDDELARLYDLNMVLKSIGSDYEFRVELPNCHEPVLADVERMLHVLVKQCKPILDGDEAAWRRLEEIGVEEKEERLARLNSLGLALKEGNRWRELPELECVRVKAADKPANAMLSLLLLLVPTAWMVTLGFVYWYALFEPPSKDKLVVVSVFTAFGIPAVLVIRWILKRFLLTQYYWQTDSTGLSIGLLFGKLFVPWADVESVALVPGRAYEVKTPARSYRLEKEALGEYCLEASIWQHLSRLGKGDRAPLSPFAMSLWATIPEAKTEEIHWTNPEAPHAWDILLRLAVWETIIWGAVIYFGLNPFSPIMAIAAFPVGATLNNLMLIRQVSVLSDRICVSTPLGSFEVSWHDVRSVQFQSQGFQPPSMRIRARGLRFLRIPWMPEHPNSTRSMLAIIRRLRQEERFRLLPFPTILMMANAEEGEG